MSNEKKMEHVSIEGHIGTWYEVDRLLKNGKTYILLEHEEYGDDAAALIVDEKGNLIHDDCWNGFDELNL